MKIKELKTICDRATQGEWYVVHNVHQDKSWIRAKSPDVDIAVTCNGPILNGDGNYISTFDPALVSKLLNLVEAAEWVVSDSDIDVGRAEAYQDSMSNLAKTLKEVI